MNSRMSKLRRSISRSFFQLNSLSRQNSLNGLVDLPTISHTALVDRFATPGNFGELKEIIKGNNDAMTEIIAAIEEKAALDFHYSKNLKKISARIHKATELLKSDVDRGWVCVAEQFDVHSTIHSNLGSALLEDVAQPLKSIHSTQKKTIHTAENFVERETKRLKERKEDTRRMKRSLYSSSKELEKVEHAAEMDKINRNKYVLRLKKLRDQVEREEEEYLWQNIDLEKQRRVTENVLRKGVESMEAVEKQRLAHCQTAIGRYQRKIEHLAPNIQQMFDRHTANLDIAVDSDPDAHVSSIQPSTSAVNHITLMDLFAENFGEVMSSSRRKQSLERVSAILNAELQRIYNKGTADVMVTNGRQMNNLDFIEYLFYKINDSLNMVDGGQHQGYHRLARFQRKIKDKTGLPTTILTIPLTGDDATLPPSETYSSSIPTSSKGSEEDYDKISEDGFYSEYSGNSNNDQEVHSICRALYDFDAKHPDEIDIRAGQCILVEGRVGDDWLIGHVMSDHQVPGSQKSGRFPKSYVTF